MKEETMVTIITMTYKNFSGIKKTVNSVLSQSYERIEYIISDDGSDNFPKDEIQNMIEGKIHQQQIIQNMPNVGTVRNATGACKAAHGKYILFLSCGDVFYERDSVKKIVERFEKEQCELLAVRRVAFTGDYFPMFFMPHLGAIKLLNKMNTSQKQYNAYITTHSWDAVSGSALYYKKEILEEYNYFDNKYRLWEDGPFIERYLRSNAITYAFDIIGIWYEYGGISTSKTPNPILLKDQQLFDRTDRFAKKNELDTFCRRYIDYIYKRSHCSTKKDIIVVMLLYPDSVFTHAIYKIKNKIFNKQDVKYLQTHQLKKPDLYFKEVMK